MINEHDITKNMLESIRNQANSGKGLINESTEEAQDLSGGELAEEEKKFMDIVTSRVEFGEFKIHPGANNVIFSGKLDNGIEWQFSKTDGLFINASNIELDDEGLETLRKLNGYYQNWSDEWAEKLNKEYKTNVEG